MSATLNEGHPRSPSKTKLSETSDRRSPLIGRIVPIVRKRRLSRQPGLAGSDSVPMDMAAQWALAGALAWASGFRLYATVFIVGLLGHFEVVQLPASLSILQHPWVLIASGILTVGEFLADKVPAFDSFWDALNTLVRIPAGAMLAWGAMGEEPAATQFIAALAGGFVSGGTHLFKSGGRALINTSPEPVSNWAASFTEDGVLLVGLWLALQHPWIFLVLLVAFLALVIWLLPRLWRAVASLFRRLRRPGGTGPDHGAA